MFESHLPPINRDHYLTIEEAAKLAGSTRQGIYSATKHGRLRPVKHKRRNFFPRNEVEAYRDYLAHRWASKEEAMALFEQYPELPVTDAGRPLVSPTNWQVFTAYASDPAVTYEQIGEQFHITRQRVQQHVAVVIERLTELDVL